MTGKLDLNSLAQVIDTSWGRSSTPKTSSYSVKLTLQGSDRLLASYAVIVNFGSERERIEMKRQFETEAIDVVADMIKTAKTNYKSLTGSTLNVKEVSSSDSVEVISTSVYNPKRTACYRRKTFYEVG